MKILLSAMALLLPLTAAGSTLYKCTDTSGAVLFTNQKTSQKNCIVLSQQTPPPAASGSGKQRTTATPTPGDFPRVSGNEQRSRDSDRRAILDKELANELQNVDKAKKALFDAGNQPAEKLQPLRDTVALHERNVESLKKELGNLH